MSWASVGASRRPWSYSEFVRFLIAYSKIVHRLRNVLLRAGMLPTHPGPSVIAIWARSLFSVLDFRDFASLDVPWWTFRSGATVQRFLAATPRARVFEWGSGASTVWLSSRSSEVVCIESDAQWAAVVSAALPPHASVVLASVRLAQTPEAIRSKRWGFRGLDFTDYVGALQMNPGPWNLIVIDGRAREACFELALSHLAPEGIIVFDNTNRRRYRAALAAHRESIVVDSHTGLTPIVLWPTRTSIVRLAA